jgi:ABC-type Zn uptake system ZnuABC Zn-binding protein ZnuA
MTAPRRMLALAFVCLAPLAAAAGCGDDEDASSAASGDITVVATTTQAADLARAVAGDRAQVTGLIPPNADPHDYEVRPGDIKALADADVVIRSGGDLDDWLADAIESSGTDARELVLIDKVDTIEGDHGHQEEDEHAAEEEEHAGEEEEHAGEEEEHAGEEEEIDPHWWQDPRNAAKAVAAIEATLAAADADGAATYARNAAAYDRRLTALDGAVADCIDQLPPAQRKLVTTHDALGYYAKRYGLDVVGAVIPSLSTQAQASAGEVTELVDTIKREQVKAIFAESSVNPKLEQVVADQAGAEIGKALWADTLGPEGSDGDTYLKSIAANTSAIVDGLSGGAVSCTLPD